MAKELRSAYVLHAFAKKSTLGKATPKKDLELVKRRLRAARVDYAASFSWRGQGR